MPAQSDSDRGGHVGLGVVDERAPFRLDVESSTGGQERLRVGFGDAELSGVEDRVELGVDTQHGQVATESTGRVGQQTDAGVPADVADQVEDIGVDGAAGLGPLRDRRRRMRTVLGHQPICDLGPPLLVGDRPGHRSTQQMGVAERSSGDRAGGQPVAAFRIGEMRWIPPTYDSIQIDQ